MVKNMSGRPKFDNISAVVGTLCIGPLLGLAIAMNVAKDQGIIVFEGGTNTVVNDVLYRNYLISGALIGFVPAVIISVIFWKIYKKTPEGSKRMRLLFIMFFLIIIQVFAAALCMTSLSGK